jgi:hypothetical protein
VSRLFFSLALRALMVCAGITLTVKALPGRANDFSPDLTAFGFATCNLPCFAGVIPGVTFGEDLEPLLTDTISATDFQRLSSDAMQLSYRGETGRFSGSITLSNGKVQSFLLNAQVPLGHLMSQLGAPTCIYVDRLGVVNSATTRTSLFRVTWYTADYLIQAAVPMLSRRLQIHTPTMTVYIYYATRLNSISPQLQPLPCHEGRSWRGFGTYERYFGASGIN